MMHLARKTRLFEAPDGARGPEANPFSTDAPAGGIIAQGCHECECEQLFAQVMQRVLRVKNLCSDDVCRVETFDAFRNRNRAISADYARIYMQPLGEARRLKFAGGAAFGSTHIGYAMDLAAETLEAWGSTRARNPTDLLMPDGTEISQDWRGPTLDGQELGSSLMTGVDYDATLTGLRRLTYGNLAIYMDLGAVLWFCQMHEQRFHFFRDRRTDAFIDCFQRFVAYVMSNHGADHEIYGENGSFGADAQGWIENGLRAIAENRIGDSLSIIDHEQRVILQDFMYTLGPGVPSDKRLLLGTDQQFQNFMNALETVQFGGGVGTSALFNGIRAQFSAGQDVHRLLRLSMSMAGTNITTQSPQPLLYGFDGGDFASPDVRTPWFKEVVRHFIKAEANQFDWPSPDMTSSYSFEKPGGPNYSLAQGSPDLTAILYADLRRIQGGG